MFYDNVGFGDIDMTAFRLGEKSGMSRDEVRKFFSQRNFARWKPDEDEEETNLNQKINMTVKQRLVEEDGYVAMELSLKELYGGISEELAQLQQSGAIPGFEVIPSGWSARQGSKYHTLLQKYNLSALQSKLQDLLALRKRTYKNIRHRLREKIRDEIKAKSKAVQLQTAQKASRTMAGKGLLPQGAKDASTSKFGRSAAEIALANDDFEYESADERFDSGVDEGVDEEVVESQNAGGREEPECWEE
jgi:hypothetical protein